MTIDEQIVNALLKQKEKLQEDIRVCKNPEDVQGSRDELRHVKNALQEISNKQIQGDI